MVWPEKDGRRMITFIVNPKAGGGTCLDKMTKVEKLLRTQGVEYEFVYTEYPKHACELAAKAALSGSETVVACGGDGTINETLNGLVAAKKALADKEGGSEVKLGVMPCGTGNDFMRSAAMDTDLFVSLKRVLQGNSKRVDYIDISGIAMICFSNAGIDCEVVQLCNKEKRKTKLSYVKNLIKCVFSTKYYDYTVEINGEKKQFCGVIVSVLNGSSIASGLNYCPGAEVDDKLLDVVIVKKKNRLVMACDLIALAAGRLQKRATAEYLKASSVKITSDCPVVDVDGELYYGLDYDARIADECIRLVCD